MPACFSLCDVSSCWWSLPGFIISLGADLQSLNHTINLWYYVTFHWILLLYLKIRDDLKLTNWMEVVRFVSVYFVILLEPRPVNCRGLWCGSLRSTSIRALGLMRREDYWLEVFRKWEWCWFEFCNSVLKPKMHSLLRKKQLCPNTVLE